MKKNKMMRMASMLLILVLLTTCTISGTFAKYTTSASATDTARVAKWGIELAVTGEGVFSTEYEGGNKTVISSNTDKLVAPGTKNENGISFSIKGTPEVAFKVEVTLGEGENFKDVFLKAANGKYLDYTTANDTADKFNLDKDYYPVVFTLTHTYETGAYSIAPAVAETGAVCTKAAGKDTVTGTLTQINAVLKNLTDSMTSCAPGYTLDDEFKLTWKWDFEQTNTDLYDKADTLLGNLAVNKTKYGDGLVDGTDYNLELKYNFNITVTQVD